MNGPSGGPARRPRMPARNRADASLSRAGTMMWFSSTVMVMLLDASAGLLGDGPPADRHLVGGAVGAADPEADDQRGVDADDRPVSAARRAGGRVDGLGAPADLHAAGAPR